MSVLPVFALAAAAVGCADSDRGGTTPATPATAPVPITGPSAPSAAGCGELKSSDIARVAPQVGVLTSQAMTRPRGSSQLCGKVFFDSSGALVVGITQEDEGPRALRSARASGRAQALRQRLRRVPELGAGAFLAGGRILGFARGRRVAILQTGYGEGNALLLSPARLIRLGKVVAARL